MEHFETRSTKMGGVNPPKKAIVALLLAFAMLLCAPVLAFADTVKELKSGQSVTASADNSFFKYTATKDGRVAFVTGNDDTTYSYIELYKYENKTSRIDYSYNQGWASPYNSRIIYKMKAGQTVYLSCEGSENSSTWSYPVEAIADENNLALARPYYNGDDETAGTDKNGLPIFDLCLKASKGEKHLVQNKDFKIDSFKTTELDSGEDVNGTWTKEKPTKSGYYLVKLVGTGNYKGSNVVEAHFYFDEDGSLNWTEVNSKEYKEWSNNSSSTRSDVYATTANGENVQGSDFLNNPLASVAAWIDGAWKTLTAGTDYEFSKDNITTTDDPNWFQATIKGIGDWANNLETSFLFQVCDHKNLEEVQAKEPQCKSDTPGYIHHWTCPDCGLSFSDANATKILDVDDMEIYANHTWGEWKTTKEPTCTTDGSKERTCTVCGDIDDESIYIPELGHKVDKWTIESEPTGCSWEDRGLKTGECSVCGETVFEYFEKDHTWGEWIVEEKPTCENEGREHRYCKVCNEYDWKVLPSLGGEHSWSDWVVDEESTCSKKGSKHRTCNICKDTQTKSISRLEHSWDEGKVTKQPTCTEVGIKTFTCKDCGVTKTEGIPSDGVHAWDNGKVTDEATCNKVGTKTYTCTKCGETKTEAIAKSDHKWDSGEETTAATCNKAGVKTYTCSVCGETKTESIPATGKHSYDNGKVTKQPTCTEDGVRTFTCSVCGDTKTESVKASGHKRDAGTVATPASCEKAGTRTFKCSTCGKTLSTETIPATGKHSYGDWKVVKAAAENVKGSEERTCSVCGSKETRDIAALPASVKPGTTTAVSGATVTVASTAPAKTPSGAKAAGTVTYKKPTNASASSVTVPATVKVQGKTYVVTKLDSNAFKNNKKVKTVKLPTTITQVSSQAFSGCTALKSVSLPNVTTIGASAFKGAKGLTSVSTGKNLKTIGASAFSGSKGLKTLTVTSKSLTKGGVKGSLKGSSVKTVKVKVGSKKVNKTYVKKYKKIFTKGNAGKKASVK